MKKIIKFFKDKLFKEKFRIGIVRDNNTCSDKLFLIQYSYSPNFFHFPIRGCLCDSFHIVSPINRSYYMKSYFFMEERLTYKEAQEEIKTLKSINDIRRIHNNIYEKVKLELQKELG